MMTLLQNRIDYWIEIIILLLANKNESVLQGYWYLFSPLSNDIVFMSWFVYKYGHSSLPIYFIFCLWLDVLWTVCTTNLYDAVFDYIALGNKDTHHILQVFDLTYFCLFYRSNGIKIDDFTKWQHVFSLFNLETWNLIWACILVILICMPKIAALWFIFLALGGVCKNWKMALTPFCIELGC